MMKAAAVKEGVAAKAGELGAGNIQEMAGGMMGQVQGLIPGMKREEEVPEPAPQEEYQEYQEYQEAFIIMIALITRGPKPVSISGGAVCPVKSPSLLPVKGAFL